MDALLILSGLLLMLFGLVWLIMLAFGSSLFWGLGSLFPPLTLVYVVRHWRIARKAVLLSALGGIPLVVGFVLLASNDPVRFEAIVSLRWLTPAPIKPNELAIELHGQLNGEPFAPQQGELIDGVLSLREGQEFFAQRAVNIHLPGMANGAVHLSVLPTDAQPLPEVEVSWLLPEHDLPEARRLNHGYTLYLDLQPLAPNKMVGDFHLVLPAQFSTTLSGKIELFTNHLGYIDGKVDSHFDSRDTLSYVIEDYLQRRYANRAVRLGKLPAVSFPASSLELEVEALVNGQPQQLTLLLSKTEALGWTVQGDQFSRLPELVAVTPAPLSSLSSTHAAPPARSTVDRRLRFSLERLQRTPEQYSNLLIRVTTAQGSVAQGRFAELNAAGRIVIRREISGPGEASYILRPDEISQIELLEP
ncbi:MAG: MFS transporter [Pseudomonadaceae bacterium]|nr:MFS transporter [Pseudomonadaceae bacterium]